MTATVIQLPTDRLARRVPESSRRRHPAGGATVSPITSARTVVRHGGAAAVWADAAPVDATWLADARAVIESAESMLRSGQAASARDLCARATACFEASRSELGEGDAVELVLVRLRQLHRRAARTATGRR